MASLDDSFRDIHIHVVGLDSSGRHGAVSTKAETKYVVRQGDMREAELRPRRLVDPAELLPDRRDTLSRVRR